MVTVMIWGYAGLQKAQRLGAGEAGGQAGAPESRGLPGGD